MTKKYGPDERFASEHAELNFNYARNLLTLVTGCRPKEAEQLIHAITAFIMRDLADRREALEKEVTA